MGIPFQGQVAVITGAAGGIGRGLALALAERGAALALCDIDAAALAATAAQARQAGANVSEHVIDVGDAAAIAALPAAVRVHHSRVTMLFNNAGVALAGEFRQVSEADFEWLFAINFRGVVRMTRAFMPMLESVPQAHIVNVSSVFGFIAPPGQTAYAAAKFAVRGFTDALRHELERTRIRVVAVHPGGIATGIAHAARLSAGIEPATHRTLSDRFVHHAPTTPEQAARRILKGLDRGELRIRIGADAVLIDWLARLLPVRHWALLRRRVAKAGLMPPDRNG